MKNQLDMRTNRFLLGGMYWMLVCALTGAVGNTAVARAKKDRAGTEIVGEPVLRYPLYLYCDGNDQSPPYAASGWMGNMSVIERDDCWRDNPHDDETCIRIKCSKSSEWFGIAWQNPPNDWGHMAGGYDLSKAKKLTFWARGKRGGEKVSFKVGLLREKQQYRDSMSTQARKISLSKKWKKYTIPLRGDKKCIKTGFVWSVEKCTEGFTFYLDDITIE